MRGGVLFNFCVYCMLFYIGIKETHSGNDGPPLAKKSRGRSSQKTSGCHFYKSSALNNFSDLSLVRWYVLQYAVLNNHFDFICTAFDCSIRIVRRLSSSVWSTCCHLVGWGERYRTTGHHGEGTGGVSLLWSKICTPCSPGD